MKILYLHQYFNSPSMSGSTRSYEMARRFVRAGHEVHLITSYRETDVPVGGWKEEKIDGIHVHWYAVHYCNRLSYAKRIKAFTLFAWAASIKACRIGGDLVFASSTPLTIALPGIYSSRRLRVPMVFEVRDLWPELPVAVGALKNPILIKIAEFLEKYAYKNSSRVVALSPGMAEGIRSKGCSTDKISVIPNSSDIDLFRCPASVGQEFRKRFAFLREGPLIVYAGTLGVINGVGYLVEIARKMQAIGPEVKFLIVGDGKEEEKIRSMAGHEQVLNKNLWMMKKIPKNEMPALLSAATVATSLFVNIPEMWNNSANKFFDALAASRPVIINYQGWQAKLLSESGAGLVIPPDHPEAAAITIYDFLGNKKRLADAQEAAAKLARTKFDRDMLARQLLGVLEDAAVLKD